MGPQQFPRGERKGHKQENKKPTRFSRMFAQFLIKCFFFQEEFYYLAFDSPPEGDEVAVHRDVLNHPIREGDLEMIPIFK